MTDDHAVETLRQAAAGWRELGARLEDIIATLDREVRLALAAHWHGSGAEGFDEQWVRLRAAVQDVLPGFATAASDLESAADAAQAALEAERAQDDDAGVGSFDGEDDMFGGDMFGDAGGEPTSSSGSGSGVGSSSGASVGPSVGPGDLDAHAGSALGGDTLSQLDAMLTAAGGQTAAANESLLPLGEGGANDSTESDSSSGRTAAGSEPGDERVEESAVSPPPALGTAAVLASLSQFAAALADVFGHQPGVESGAVPPNASGGHHGVGGPIETEQPAPPRGSSAVRPSDDVFDGASRNSLSAGGSSHAGNQLGQPDPQTDTDTDASTSSPAPPGGAFG